MSLSANYYSFRFSQQVVLTFLRVHDRGWTILREIWPELTEGMIVKVFQLRQRKWNIFKKLIRLAERLESSKKHDRDFIKKRCLTSVKYFNAYEDKLSTYHIKNVRKVLDAIDLKSIES